MAQSIHFQYLSDLFSQKDTLHRLGLAHIIFHNTCFSQQKFKISVENVFHVFIIYVKLTSHNTRHYFFNFISVGVLVAV